MRKWTGPLVFLLFFLVPYLNLFRIDIPTGHYYWFTRRFPFSEALPLLLTVLLLVFTVFGLSFFRPRLFCSHMCPHNTTSRWLRKLMQWKLDIPVGILLAPLVSFTLLSYFAAPATVWAALTRGTSTILLVAFVVLTVFVGYLLLRLRQDFCKMVCPYGFFQHLFAPDAPKRSQQWIVVIVLLLLTAGMVTTATLTSSVEISLVSGTRVPTPNAVTYTYTVTLANDSAVPETFTLRHLAGPPPAGSPFMPPPLVAPGESKGVPVAFRVAHTEVVQFEVCATQSAICKPFSISLSGP